MNIQKLAAFESLDNEMCLSEKTMTMALGVHLSHRDNSSSTQSERFPADTWTVYTVTRDRE